MPSQIPPRFLLPVIAACSQLLLKSVSKLFENVEWSNSLLRHFKIQALLKINCCMAAISAFRVTQHSQSFSFFFRNRIQCIALYQLHNSQALLNLRRSYFRADNYPVVFIVIVSMKKYDTDTFRSFSSRTKFWYSKRLY